MSEQQENGLGEAASAYLRSARTQPVAWMEWGAEAFARAQREDKPVLLDIGAVWCHWCHVMDRESYEDADTAAVINEFFVAVKVDRDERPDVDTRYQAAVASISGQGGWPLTAFLTPEGMPYFGGTYFPPEERYGRPSFQRVLLTMADAFRSRRAEVDETAGSILEAIRESEDVSGRDMASGGTLGEKEARELLAKLLEAAVGQFDGVNGGFGSQPKFPHSTVLELLLDAAGRGGAGAERAAEIVRTSLLRMADGGMHDQLGGGFHRYSVDERWHVPHFEKMAYDNSELLRVYVHAGQSLREPRLLEVATDIVRWMSEVLSDGERGGFFGSQDADESLEDDGDYFTWTEAEMRSVLAPEEFAAAKAYFGARAVGDMHHNPAKNVLRRMGDADWLASALGVSEEEAQTRLARATVKLRAKRAERRAPYVDRTIYTGWNAMCVSAFLAYAAALPGADLKPREFALRSLDRALAEAWDPELGLGHVAAYGVGMTASTRVAGVLDDYAFTAVAALDAWEASGERRYFAAARKLVDAMLQRFWDEAAAGFFDTEAASGPVLGVLSARRKPLQDAPSPAGNSVAANVLFRMAELTGEPMYAARARATLQTFTGVVEHFGLYAASFGLALRHAVEAPVQVCVLGVDTLAVELAAAAQTGYAVNNRVVRLGWDQLDGLPGALAETLPFVARAEGSMAVVCRGMSCLPPVRSVEELRRLLG